MNIQTVADNLKRTIANKEQMLADLEVPIVPGPERMAKSAVAEFLAINIDELKRILVDIEKCIARDVEQSWRDNPDRMGGQYTQEEIDRADRWI